MFGSFQIWGHKAHLVLEDENGAFEISDPFTLNLDGTITVNTDTVVEAIQERRSLHSPPLQRAVRLDVA